MEQAASRRRWPWTGRTYEPPLRASDHFYRSRVGCGCLPAAGVRFGVGLVTFQCLRVSGVVMLSLKRSFSTGRRGTVSSHRVNIMTTHAMALSIRKNGPQRATERPTPTINVPNVIA